MDPRCMVGRIHRVIYIATNTILNIWVFCGVGEEDFLCFPNATIPPSFTQNLNSRKHIKLSILQKTRKLVHLHLYSFQCRELYKVVCNDSQFSAKNHLCRHCNSCCRANRVA